jgi:hypothetical protein
MRFSALLIASSLAVGVLPGVAFADPAQSADPAQASNSDPNQIVCKSLPPPTGTRLGGGRECHTQRDWDNQMKEAQRVLQEKQALSRGTSGD